VKLVLTCHYFQRVRGTSYTIRDVFIDVIPTPLIRYEDNKVQ
jgi:hypothetical protein